ncbi:PREDICTED: transmembrane emp24 domain-containing protein 6-like [Branchiostoma belcheri]|uniref:Transmembrane emp24 domain-containing protein 6-like n=1 Tax=Branchiostoma belcheri TaxID=7741 RepID=A0A6P5A2K8_BRABE|nr:PREDICTED: transmembrane emp24 domain-containing protein 6-like [Branchiostoma belcheri]
MKGVTVQFLVLSLTCECLVSAWDEDQEFDSNALPGVESDFSLSIGTSKPECFYQFVGENATLHANFQVLRTDGTDKKVIFTVHDPKKTLLNFTQAESMDKFEYDMKKQDVPGTFSICLSNPSKLYNKLVYLYVAVYRLEDWEKYRQIQSPQEMEAMGLGQITTSLNHVADNVKDIGYITKIIKLHKLVDFYTVSSSLNYVTRMGLCNCVLIVGSGLLQVYFVRKLFASHSVRGTSASA